MAYKLPFVGQPGWNLITAMADDAIHWVVSPPTNPKKYSKPIPVGHWISRFYFPHAVR